MITRNEEFGAPWNDQFYTVEFHWELDIKGLIFSSEQDSIIITLPGPKQYSDLQIKKHSIDRIYELYEGLLDSDFDNKLIITKIK